MKCQLIQALSVITIQMYLILFIKIWALPSWKATTDKKYISLEMKDGWESLILKCCCQIAWVLGSHSITKLLPSLCSAFLASGLSKAESLELTKKERHVFFFNLPESIYEIALTIINRMWILYFSDTTPSHRMTFWVRRDLKDHLYFTLRKR